MYHFYLSFKFAGETQENKHQYISEYTDESGEMLFFEEKIDPELEYFYFMKTCYSQPSTCIEFLEYHYSQYLLKNPGKQINFIYFVEERLNKTFGFTYKDPEGDKFVRDEETIPLLRQTLIREWIEKKKNELNTAETPTPKRTIPKLNEYNKPALNQVQISILFRIMKDLNIISNRDLPKTTYSEIIQTLTGYSANPLRINFSASQLIEISDRPQDYQQIIENLYRIIDKLERAKNEITTAD